MTLKLMDSLGTKYEVNKNIFKIHPGSYKSPNTIKVEGDWSAASYYFSICALSNYSDIKIKGLFANSIQGDSVLTDIYKQLGVQSFFDEETYILKNKSTYVEYFEYDFSNCPDLAQTVAVTCAALGIRAKFSGLESLKIKETDRTTALSLELAKFGVKFYEKDDSWMLEGRTTTNIISTINTYEDHRMAMSFAPLAVVHKELMIEDPDVVKKSYPSFWNDLGKLGYLFTL
jgi:3-phosphoshikimate 1-carboxyvinyltransferase